MGQFADISSCEMKDNLLQFCLMFLLWPLCVAAEKCCKDVLLDVSDQDSDVHILQGGRLGFYKQIGLYGGKAQYKQVDGNNYMFFSAKESLWLTTSDQVGNTSTGITSNYTGDCIGSTSEWQYYNGTDWRTHKNLTAKCAKIEDTCCHNIEMSSPTGTTTTKDNSSSSSLVYAEEARKTLGKYTAVGTDTGRYIYQHQEMDRYLQFDKTNMNWLVVHQVGTTSGFTYHKGGSVCAENSGDQWHVASLDNNKTTTSWQHDPQFSVTCVKEKTEKTTTTKITTTTTTKTTTTTTTTSTKEVRQKQHQVVCPPPPQRWTLQNHLLLKPKKIQKPPWQSLWSLIQRVKAVLSQQSLSASASLLFLLSSLLSSSTDLEPLGAVALMASS